MLQYVMLCYAVSCYVMLCYGMLCIQYLISGFMPLGFGVFRVKVWSGTDIWTPAHVAATPRAHGWPKGSRVVGATRGPMGYKGSYSNWGYKGS